MRVAPNQEKEESVYKDPNGFDFSDEGEDDNSPDTRIDYDALIEEAADKEDNYEYYDEYDDVCAEGTTCSMINQCGEQGEEVVNKCSA